MELNRRGFIAGLGSSAAWPRVARAQRPRKVSRIGILPFDFTSDGSYWPVAAGFAEPRLEASCRIAPVTYTRLRVLRKPANQGDMRSKCCVASTPPLTCRLSKSTTPRSRGLSIPQFRENCSRQACRKLLRRVLGSDQQGNRAVAQGSPCCKRRPATRCCNRPRNASGKGRGTWCARCWDRYHTAMIELAHRLHPHLDFREGSAEELRLDSSSFDAVISGFGVGHVSRPERVLAEFARVLVPKGRVALSWWDGLGKNRINGILFEAINELGISASGALPAGPAVDRFSDPNEFAKVLRAAGFEVVGIDHISFSHPLKSVDELWDLALGSFVRVSTVIGTQTADVQQRIRAKIERIAQQYASANGLQIPDCIRVITGIR